MGLPLDHGGGERALGGRMQNWVKRAVPGAVLLGGLLWGSTALADTELKLMLFGGPVDVAIWDKLSADFEASHPGIQVTVEVNDWDSYWEKLRVLIAGGTAPDVFAMDASNYPDWQARGALMHLQPLIDAEPDLLADVYPVSLEAYQTPDGYYGLPRDFQTIALFYNKDMFDAAGVAYPTDQWTWDDLRAAAKQLTRDTNGDGSTDQWGLFAELIDMEAFWSSVLWSHGADIVDAANGKTLIGSPEAMTAWNFIAGMVLDDKSIPTAEQLRQFGADGFQAGVTAMGVSGHWSVPDYAPAGFRWDVAPVPKGPVARVTSVNSAGFTIASTTKHPAEAWELLKFAIGPHAQEELAGIGFAIPIQKSIAEGPTFLEQKSAPIDHKLFVDALAYARVKPVFRGYEEWASAVGDALQMAWSGALPIADAIQQAVDDGDAVLANAR